MSNLEMTTDAPAGITTPNGWDGKWIQTIPGKCFMAILGIYGPLEPWFDQTWRPGEIAKL